jgi:hypothetical protein
MGGTIKIDLGELECKVVDCIHLAHDNDSYEHGNEPLCFGLAEWRIP